MNQGRTQAEIDANVDELWLWLGWCFVALLIGSVIAYLVPRVGWIGCVVCISSTVSAGWVMAGMVCGAGKEIQE